jgi:hypothetical protein
MYVSATFQMSPKDKWARKALVFDLAAHALLHAAHQQDQHGLRLVCEEEQGMIAPLCMYACRERKGS